MKRKSLLKEVFVLPESSDPGSSENEVNEGQGNFQEWYQAAYDYVDVNMGKNAGFMEDPEFIKRAKKAFRKGEDPYTFMASESDYGLGEAAEDDSFGDEEEMRESHGENAAKRHDDSEFDVDRLSRERARNRDLLGADDGFGWKDPDEHMFFGDKTGADLQDFEDPTSSKNTEPISVDMPGADFGEEPEESGFGSAIDPKDVPGEWNERGVPRDPDDDIDMEAGYGDDELPSNADMPYWKDREYADRMDNVTEPFRQRRGQGSKPGLGARRKPYR